jgi:hypothetical protein
MLFSIILAFPVDSVMTKSSTYTNNPLSTSLF